MTLRDLLSVRTLSKTDDAAVMLAAFSKVSPNHRALSRRQSYAVSCQQRQGMKNFGWRKWLVVLAFVVAVSATGLFAVRTVRRAVYWRSHRDEAIRPWMNVGYIAHSYRVPPWVLHQALGLPSKPDRRPIRQIAREQGRSVDQVIAILEAAIVHSRPPYPPPAAAPPPELRDHGPPKGPQAQPSTPALPLGEDPTPGATQGRLR